MRYAPGRNFPPYAYLPGRDPHPTGDPDGHSFEQEGEGVEPPGDPTPVYLPPHRWAENERYLFGVDLYNGGYLWEAHEAWEGLWHVSKLDKPQAQHLQGLIQCAAACLKIAMGQPRGLARLTVLGTEKIERTALSDGPVYMGLDALDFVKRMRAFAASNPKTHGGRPRLELS